MDHSLSSATNSLKRNFTEFTSETNKIVKNLEKMFDRTVLSIENFTKSTTIDGIKVRADPTSISLVPKGKKVFYIKLQKMSQK